MAFSFSQVSSRERLLLVVFGGIAFVLGNFWLAQKFLYQRSLVLSQMEASRGSLELSREQALGLEEWQEKVAWLRTQQRKLENPDQASQQLYERITEAAKKRNVLPTQPPTPKPLATTDQCQFVSFDLETNSSWPDLVHFLYDLQDPKDAVVYEKVELTTDPADKTKVRGKFTIAQYYAR
jgi:hypothetical protein